MFLIQAGAQIVMIFFISGAYAEESEYFQTGGKSINLIRYK